MKWTRMGEVCTVLLLGVLTGCGEGVIYQDDELVMESREIGDRLSGLQVTNNPQEAIEPGDPPGDQTGYEIVECKDVQECLTAGHECMQPCRTELEACLLAGIEEFPQVAECYQQAAGELSGCMEQAGYDHAAVQVCLDLFADACEVPDGFLDTTCLNSAVECFHVCAGELETCLGNDDWPDGHEDLVQCVEAVQSCQEQCLQELDACQLDISLDFSVDVECLAGAAAGLRSCLEQAGPDPAAIQVCWTQFHEACNLPGPVDASCFQESGTCFSGCAETARQCFEAAVDDLIP